MRERPSFTFTADDPDAPMMLRTWARQKLYEVERGTRPHHYRERAKEALFVADQMEAWRKINPETTS